MGAGASGKLLGAFSDDDLKKELSSLSDAQRKRLSNIINGSKSGGSEPSAVASREGALNQPGHWKYFLSYKQNEGIAEVTALSYELGRGNVWLDANMPDKSPQAMEEGVNHSRVFLAVLTPGYFASSFCRSELRWAKSAPGGVITCYPQSIPFGDILASMEEHAETKGEFDWVKQIDSKPLLINDAEYMRIGVGKIEQAATAVMPSSDLSDSAAAAGQEPALPPPEVSIANAKTGLIMAITGWNDSWGYAEAKGKCVCLWDKNSSLDKKWFITPEGSIVNVVTGLAMAILGWDDSWGYKEAKGARIIMWDKNAGLDKRWHITPDGSIVNTKTGLVMAIAGWDDSWGYDEAKGAQICLWDKNDSGDKKWLRAISIA